MFAFSSLTFNALICICFWYFGGRPHTFIWESDGRETKCLWCCNCNVLAVPSPFTVVLTATSPQMLLESPYPDPSSSSAADTSCLQPQTVSSSQSSGSARPPLLWVVALDVLLTCVTLWMFRSNVPLFRLHPLQLWSVWNCRRLSLLLLPILQWQF